MNYEKKYKEALSRARQFSEHPLQEDSDSIVEYIFPELAESEDEKVRKALAEMVHDTTGDELWVDYNVHKEEALAWLEKQGEIGEDLIAKKYLINKGYPIDTNGTFPTFEEMYNIIREGLEKQGEHKPTIEMKTPEESLGIDSKTYNKIIDECIYGENKPDDNVEPKFKVGDWVVENGVNRNPVQITSFEEDKGSGIKVWFSNGTGTYIEFLKGYHKWTIQDAKDGDVLCCESGWTCIFKNSDNISFSSYCFMDSTGWFCETGSESHTLEKAFIKAYNGNIYPATKEQRELLFQKIKEAGYEWDAEKKELKKIEQKPTAWSEKVDLEKEKDAYICNHFSEGSDGGMISDAHREIGGVTYFDLSNIAEHFFELGLKAKKENKL